MKEMINKIYNMNCIDLMAKMKANNISIDLTVTSPPYDNLRTYNNTLAWNEDIWKQVLRGLYDITKVGGVVVWVVGDATIKGSETGTSFKQALYAIECGFNLHDTMIWEKTSYNYDPRNGRYKQFFEYMFILTKGKIKTFNPINDVPIKSAGKIIKSSKTQKNGNVRDYGSIKMKDFQARGNVWRISKELKSEHPAPFSEQLAFDHIISWSNEHDLVFDPFTGSGTTLKVAKDLDRNFIGSEIVDKYFEIAKKRIEVNK